MKIIGPILVVLLVVLLLGAFISVASHFRGETNKNDSVWDDCIKQSADPNFCLCAAYREHCNKQK